MHVVDKFSDYLVFF
ncbi:hypothetical protein D043_0038A, partial [Vibrio parahaemolyticus EKP-021]